MLISTPSTVSWTDTLLCRVFRDHAAALKSCTRSAGQVEMKRVGIPAHVPCAVQQWEGLIASKAQAASAASPSSCSLPASWSCAIQLKLQHNHLYVLHTCTLFAAVNYPARAAGITRHMRRAEAKAKCPELQCVHVETIGKLNTANSFAPLILPAVLQC